MAAAEDQASATRLAPLDEACLPAAQALSAHFGWPHRVEDWRWALALGDGFGAFDGGQPDGGRLVGTGLCWRFGTAASLGLVVVAPAAQGRGLGRRITSALLGRIGEAPVVLHATEAGLPLYASLGFVAEGTVCQYQGTTRRRGHGLGLLLQLGVAQPVSQADALQQPLHHRRVEQLNLRAPQRHEGQRQHQRVGQHAPGFAEGDAASCHGSLPRMRLS